MISKTTLENEYLTYHKSMQEIASKLGCSLNKVVYYMDKHGIPRRSRSEAIYLKHNPNGDPFKQSEITTLDRSRLMGLGIGLYWGEGNKSNKHSIRIGNTDAKLIGNFIVFLVELFGVNKEDLRFSLQIFSDVDPEKALEFWMRKLDVKRSQFYKITVTITGSIGTYRKKSEYGVCTLYYHNKKLRDILVDMLPR